MPSQLLIDEQLSPQIAARLRDKGYDVEAVVDCADLVGSTDREVLALAARQGRAVVTNNVKDFCPLPLSGSLTVEYMPVSSSCPRHGHVPAPPFQGSQARSNKCSRSIEMASLALSAGSVPCPAA